MSNAQKKIIAWFLAITLPIWILPYYVVCLLVGFFRYVYGQIADAMEIKMKYIPDNWVVIKTPQCYKVLAGWSGGYLDADEWRLNSGITGCHMEKDGDYYFFNGSSGSVYRCHKDSYGLRTNNAYIFDSFQNKVGEKHFVLMPEDTNWLEMDWGLK